MRRILIIIGIVLLIGVVIFVGYYLQSRQQPADTASGEAPTNQGSGQTLPPGGAGAGGTGAGKTPPAASAAPGAGGGASEVTFGVISERPVVAYTVDAQNNVLLVQPDGQVVKIAPGGVETILSSAPITDLGSAAFSANGQKLIAVAGEQTAPQTSVFDVQTKAWKVLSGEMRSPVWSPNDLRIAFIATDNPQRAVLATLDLKDPKATPRALAEIRAQDLVLAWPNPGTLIVSEKPSAYVQGSVWKFSISARTLMPVLTNARGLSTAWTSDLKYGIAFRGDAGNRGGSFSVLDSAGAQLNRFDVVSLPEKCGFVQMSSTPPVASSTTATGTKPVKPTPALPPAWFAVCGFPQDTRVFNLYPEPDSYLERAVLTADHLYKVDMETGVVVNLLPDNPYVFDTSLVTIHEKKVFFVNRIDRRLYALTLP